MFVKREKTDSEKRTEQRGWEEGRAIILNCCFYKIQPSASKLSNSCAV